MKLEKLNDRKREKYKIVQRFDRAAQTYSKAAMLQKKVGKHLLQLLEGESVSAKTIVNLGAGDGLLAKQLAAKFLNGYSDHHLMHLDLAQQMLKYGCNYMPHNSVSQVCADFDRLPYADRAVDFIFSNMALQWSLNFAETLSELYRVLSVQGTLLFSMPISGSLFELHQSIQSIDPDRIVNHFMNAGEINRILSQLGFKLSHCETQKVSLLYDDFSEMMRKLHDSGTNYVKYKKVKSLTSRSFINKLAQAYQKFGNEKHQLPMTFYIYYVKVCKEI